MCRNIIKPHDLPSVSQSCATIRKAPTATDKEKGMVYALQGIGMGTSFKTWDILSNMAMCMWLALSI